MAKASGMRNYQHVCWFIPVIVITPGIDMPGSKSVGCVSVWLGRQVTRLVGPGECFYLGRRGPA